jgi:hypothetical protein
MLLVISILLEASIAVIAVLAARQGRPYVYGLVLLSQKVAFWELGIPDNFGRFVFRHEELRWITQ